MIETKQIDVNASQQSISRSLRIPISKVKSLIYETQLRDNQYDQSWFLRELALVLRTARLAVSKSTLHIKLAIENPMLRKELESKIKKLNGFADYSFNNEILKFDCETYGLLIKEIIATPSEQVALENALKSAINKKTTEIISWKELVNEFLKNAASSAGENVMDLTFGYLSGGASLFAKSMKEILNQTT